MRLGLDNFSLWVIDQSGISGGEIAKVLGVAIDHLHGGYLVPGKTNHLVVDGRGIAIPFFVGQRDINHLALLTQAHGLSKL